MRLDGDMAGCGFRSRRYRQVYHKSLGVGKAQMKPVDDIRTYIERGKFASTRAFQNRHLVRAQAGPQGLEKPVKRCQRPCRDNIGTDGWQDRCACYGQLPDPVSRMTVRRNTAFSDRTRRGSVRHRTTPRGQVPETPRHCRHQNPACPGGHKRRKLGGSQIWRIHISAMSRPRRIPGCCHFSTSASMSLSIVS